jgi:hypothetical protein
MDHTSENVSSTGFYYPQTFIENTFNTACLRRRKSFFKNFKRSDGVQDYARWKGGADEMINLTPMRQKNWSTWEISERGKVLTTSQLQLEELPITSKASTLQE